jgi:TRAP-type mannitol/chloroaromatic compound transport system substrate-binding protein
MSFNRKLFIVKTAVSGLVLALTATTLAQTTETLIAVSYQGKERATFVPRSMPYFETRQKNSWVSSGSGNLPSE